MSQWWLLWMAFVLVFCLSPVGYGWGFRGWGPPYPRYFQRRRGLRAAVIGGPPGFDHHAWGWRGDFVWMALFVGMAWFITAILWPVR